MSPAAGSLHDVRRMLTQFVHTFPSFSHALLGGEANNLSSVTENRRERGTKRDIVQTRGKDPLSTECYSFFFLRVEDGNEEEVQREREGQKGNKVPECFMGSVCYEDDRDLSIKVTIAIPQIKMSKVIHGKSVHLQ